MGIIQNLLEKGFSAFYKKISFLPQSFSTKEFSAYEPDASDIRRISYISRDSKGQRWNCDC